MCHIVSRVLKTSQMSCVSDESGSCLSCKCGRVIMCGGIIFLRFIVTELSKLIFGNRPLLID